MNKLLTIINGPTDTKFTNAWLATREGGQVYFVVQPSDTDVKPFRLYGQITGMDHNFRVPNSAMMRFRLPDSGLFLNGQYDLDAHYGWLTVEHIDETTALPLRLFGIGPHVLEQLESGGITTLPELTAAKALDVARLLTGQEHTDHPVDRANAELAADRLEAISIRLNAFRYSLVGWLPARRELVHKLCETPMIRVYGPLVTNTDASCSYQMHNLHRPPDGRIRRLPEAGQYDRRRS